MVEITLFYILICIFIYGHLTGQDERANIDFMVSMELMGLNLTALNAAFASVGEAFRNAGVSVEEFANAFSQGALPRERT